jgi:hypothetical protein
VLALWSLTPLFFRPGAQQFIDLSQIVALLHVYAAIGSGLDGRKMVAEEGSIIV